MVKSETINKPNKFKDLYSILGPIEKKPELKTIQECYEEAGHFPFHIKCLVHVPDNFVNEGEICIIEGILPNGNFLITNVNKKPYTRDKNRIHAKSKYKRWQLLGHIPK